MKLLYTSAIFILLATQFISCKKEQAVIYDFSNFSETDSNCLYTGAVDGSDWGSDAEWTTWEYALMKFSAIGTITDTLTGFVEISPACPNPSEGLFIVGLNTQRQCKMKIACVNPEMETLFYSTKILTGGPIIT